MKRIAIAFIVLVLTACSNNESATDLIVGNWTYDRLLFDSVGQGRSLADGDMGMAAMVEGGLKQSRVEFRADKTYSLTSTDTIAGLEANGTYFLDADNRYLTTITKNEGSGVDSTRAEIRTLTKDSLKIEVGNGLLAVFKRAGAK